MSIKGVRKLRNTGYCQYVLTLVDDNAINDDYKVKETT